MRPSQIKFLLCLVMLLAGFLSSAQPATAASMATDYNLYRYAGNNPVMFVDPEGLQTMGVGLPEQTPTGGTRIRFRYEGPPTSASFTWEAVVYIARHAKDDPKHQPKPECWKRLKTVPKRPAFVSGTNDNVHEVIIPQYVLNPYDSIRVDLVMHGGTLFTLPHPLPLAIKTEMGWSDFGFLPGGGGQWAQWPMPTFFDVPYCPEDCE